MTDAVPTDGNGASPFFCMNANARLPRPYLFVTCCLCPQLHLSRRLRRYAHQIRQTQRVPCCRPPLSRLILPREDR